ncbi:hypothetical protein OBBRIDRAFT_523500 [Obba rivulosa]|uniref:BTB domain-containing protein n=1 Tax=Obba rivulosa TaxID=1052685 RepID=A0A8E2DNU7_9APHY|nr:hypothetical protein OBBRIDRAFT_523500 [Obba rivulosa]
MTRVPSSSPDLLPAPPPFDKSTADIILVTFDNVAFRVHSQLLSLASGFFEDMLSLPQPALDSESNMGVGDAQPLYDDLPLITLSERSGTLETLLRFLYPVPDPTLVQVEELDAILEAALKYDMVEAVGRLRERLRGFVDKAPLEVYCIACDHGFEEEACAAAKEVRSRGSQHSHVPQLCRITIGCYYRLLQYCTTQSSEQWSFCHPPKIQPQTAQAASTGDPDLASNDASSSPRLSPIIFNYPMQEASVSLWSSDGTEFRVHADILSLASPALKRRLFDLTGVDESHAASQMAPSETPAPPRSMVLVLEEDAVTISHLLENLYPVEECPERTLEEVSRSLAAARKYGMQRVLRNLTTQLWSSNTRPLVIFLIAARLNLTNEVRKAVTLILRRDRSEVDEYCAEMEDGNGETYYRLLAHVRICHKSALSWINHPNRVKSIFDTFVGSGGSCYYCDQWRSNCLSRYMESLRATPVGNPPCCLYAATSMSTLSSALSFTGGYCTHPRDSVNLTKFSEEVARQLESSLPQWDIDEDVAHVIARLN